MKENQIDLSAGPVPSPKAGDTVNYVQAVNKIIPAKVLSVIDETEGRAITVLNPDPKAKGPVRVTHRPKAALAGNTWHWPAICKDSESALSYWRKEAKGAGAEQSAWVISLDAERRFLGCDPIAWRFYAQPILLADEVLSAAKKRGAVEFVFVHCRPGVSPKAGPDEKARARAIIQAGRLAKCEALDYLLIGEKDARFCQGIFSLCHLKQFHADDPFPPKGKQSTKTTP